MIENLDSFGRSELHYAVVENDLELVHKIISSDFDVNLKDKELWTPLHCAAQNNNYEIAKLLIDAGSEIDPVDNNGNTPLFTAVFNSKGDGNLINLLRSKGANSLKENYHGQTPLGLAKLIGNYDVAQYFKDLI